jgi:hypothetical protein
VKQALKRYDLQMVKYKFILIYILNVTDVIFTLFLLSTGNYFEGNIFMKSLVTNQTASIVVKTVLPAALLYFIFKRMKQATEEQLIKANILINICMILYIIINSFHVLWVILYLILDNML